MWRTVSGVLSWISLVIGIPLCLLYLMGAFMSPSGANNNWLDILILILPPFISISLRYVADKGVAKKFWHMVYTFAIIEFILALLIISM